MGIRRCSPVVDRRVLAVPRTGLVVEDLAAVPTHDHGWSSTQHQRENPGMRSKEAMSENPTPLKTARLILRPWLDTDREPFASMSADPEVMKHLIPLASPSAAVAWIDRQQAHLETHGFCFWALEWKETGEFVGAAGLLRVGYEAHFTPAVEVGWRIVRRLWGRGLAPEAAKRAIDFGFEHLGLQEIVANAVPANRNSRRVMEKLGMSRTAADDFDHPLVPIEHPLRRQVLYRLPRDRWSGSAARIAQPDARPT